MWCVRGALVGVGVLFQERDSFSQHIIDLVGLVLLAVQPLDFFFTLGKQPLGLGKAR